MNLDRFQPPTRAEELAVDRYSQGLESAWRTFSGENALSYYQDGANEDFNLAVELHLDPAGNIQYGHPKLVKFLAGKSIEQAADQVGFGLYKQFKSDWEDDYSPAQDRPEHF